MNDPAPIAADPNPPSIAPLATMTPMFPAGYLTSWKSIATRLGIWIVALAVAMVVLLVGIVGFSRADELIFMSIVGVGTGGIFACGMLLAYGPSYLAVRCVVIIIVQCLFLGVLVVFEGGGPGNSELQRILFAICMVPITIGMLFTIGKFCGYTLQRPAVISSRQAKVSQFTIGKIIELTAIAAVMFALLRLLDKQADVFEIFWIVGFVVLGQGIPALVLLVPRYSARFRYGLMLGLWLPLLLFHLYALMLFDPQLDEREAMHMGCMHMVAANFIAMTCFTLRARGYRLIHVDCQAV